MTPLAQRIVRELTLPVKRRTFVDQCGLIPAMAGCHCFDVTEANDAIVALAEKMHMSARQHKLIEGALAFLPAPATWIEFAYKDGVREGVLLRSDEPALAVSQWASSRYFASAKQIGAIQLSEGNLATNVALPIVRDIPGETYEQQIGWQFWVYAALALINTPRIVGRRQHMPHRGLEAKLVRALGPQGKFPLHAWTEIKLDISPPKDAGGEGEHEAHLTGKRALHFVRQHLRVWNGQLVLVKAHWRGDGSLGIKRSRYKLTGEAA